MALDVQEVTLDISKQPTPEQVRLGQGDANATQLIVNVYDGGVAYDLDGYDVRLAMQLPAAGGYYEAEGTADGNVATFDIDETYAAAVDGFDGFGYVDVLDGGTVICSTSRFQLVVLRNAGEGVDPSTAYSNGIIEATERAIEAAEAAEGVVLQDVPTMSANIKGGALLGEGLSVEDGRLSLSGESYTAAEKAKLAGIEDGANDYELPTMDATTKGGAKLGSGLSMSGDTLELASHQHQASDISSGSLPIARGGTGAATAADALDALMAGGPLSIDDGALEVGEGLSSSTGNRLIVGEYNEEDASGDYAVIVGNGTADNARSNALAVDWDGAVDMWNPHIDMTTAPSSTVYDRAVEVFDKNGDPIGWLQVSQSTNGSHAVCIGASNTDDSAQNQLQLGYDANDNPTAWASEPTVLRKALGALAAGDFVVEEVSTHSSVSISAGGNSYKNGTKSKPGYWPLGIVGTYTSDFRCPLAYANLTSQASGSAGWAVNIGNWSSSSRTVNANIKILWVKE